MDYIVIGDMVAACTSPGLICGCKRPDTEADADVVHEGSVGQVLQGTDGQCIQPNMFTPGGDAVVPARERRARAQGYSGCDWYEELGDRGARHVEITVRVLVEEDFR